MYTNLKEIRISVNLKEIRISYIPLCALQKVCVHVYRYKFSTLLLIRFVASYFITFP